MEIDAAQFRVAFNLMWKIMQQREQRGQLNSSRSGVRSRISTKSRSVRSSFGVEISQVGREKILQWTVARNMPTRCSRRPFAELKFFYASRRRRRISDQPEDIKCECLKSVKWNFQWKRSKQLTQSVHNYTHEHYCDQNCASGDRDVQSQLSSVNMKPLRFRCHSTWRDVDDDLMSSSEREKNVNEIIFGFEKFTKFFVYLAHALGWARALLLFRHWKLNYFSYENNVALNNQHIGMSSRFGSSLLSQELSEFECQRCLVGGVDDVASSKHSQRSTSESIWLSIMFLWERLLHERAELATVDIASSDTRILLQLNEARNSESNS